MQGLNTLLCGGVGSGKTHSLKTFVECGITPFILFTEPGMDVVSDIPCPQLHYAFRPPATQSFAAIADIADKISKLSFKGISQMEGVNKQEFRQWYDMVVFHNDFVCDRCGEHFGSVDTWNTDRALCHDSLSGLNIMAKDLVIGNKPTAAPGEWGVGMDNEERWINTMCMRTTCWYTLLCHLERETDQATGMTAQWPSALGSKLGPKLPRFFSDVVMCRRDGMSYYWSTGTPGVELKARNLPLGEKLPPSFEQIVETWKAKGGTIQATTEQ